MKRSFHSLKSRKRHFEFRAHIDDLCVFRAFPAEGCKNSQVKSLSWGWCWMKGHRVVKWIKTFPLDTINMYNTFHWKRASNIRKMRDRLHWLPTENHTSQRQGNTEWGRKTKRIVSRNNDLFVMLVLQCVNMKWIRTYRWQLFFIRKTHL